MKKGPAKKSQPKGREEDAADQVSAYMMLHLGKAEARRLIVGTSYAYKTEAEAATAPPTMKQFADAHGTPAQRFYNLLCIAYGADAQLFGDMVEGTFAEGQSRGLQGRIPAGRLCVRKTV